MNITTSVMADFTNMSLPTLHTCLVGQWDPKNLTKGVENNITMKIMQI